MKRAYHIVLSIIAAIILPCCGSDEETGNPSAPPVTLTVGHVGHDHQIALGVAALAPEKTRAACGVALAERKAGEVYDLVADGAAVARLKIRKVKGGSGMPAAMEAGQLDIGLGGVAAVAKFVDKGADMKIIAPLHTDGDFLVVGNDYPANDWDSFVSLLKKTGSPLTVGYKAPVAVAKLIFVRALDAEGVAWSEGTAAAGAKVVMVNVHGGKNIIPSFVSGGIDAFVMNQPVPSVAKVKGIGRIIADLSTLPPRGRWSKHPCCCVAATGKTLAEHRPIVRNFLKVLIVATDIINADRQAAALTAAAWTRQKPAVEKDSVPGINYTAVPGPAYMDGLKVWATLMEEERQFTGRLKGRKPADVVENICDMSICTEALAEVRGG